MTVDDVKKQYLKIFFDYFNKKKIIEDPNFWYINEESSTSITVRCKSIDGFLFRIHSDDSFSTYTIRAEITAETRMTIKQVTQWNFRYYSKIVKTIQFLKDEKKRLEELSKVESFINKIPKNYQRALKIKSL